MVVESGVKSEDVLQGVVFKFVNEFLKCVTGNFFQGTMLFLKRACGAGVVAHEEIHVFFGKQEHVAQNDVLGFVSEKESAGAPLGGFDVAVGGEPADDFFHVVVRSFELSGKLFNGATLVPVACKVNQCPEGIVGEF